MFDIFSKYIFIGLVWGIVFNIIVYNATKNEPNRYKITWVDDLLYIFLWPVWIAIFIWGMFFKK